MSKSFFIDTTRCTGCRACQVACKQWHDLPAEETRNRGTFENPPDLSFSTYKLVRMRERVIDGKLQVAFLSRSSAVTASNRRAWKRPMTRPPSTRTKKPAPSSLPPTRNFWMQTRSSTRVPTTYREKRPTAPWPNATCVRTA